MSEMARVEPSHERELRALMATETIIVIEDEQDILDLLVYNLEREGYRVITASRGDQGLVLIQQNSPDLVVLDLMLPGLDGLSICQQVKANSATSSIPIIMLSAKVEDSDIVIGLGLGADDYVTKPFSPRELVARVKVALRKVTVVVPEEPLRLVYEELIIDFTKHEISVSDKKVMLTPTEFKLLQVLASNPGKAFTREEILSNVFGYEVVLVDRNIDVHIRSIRKKLGSAADMIETIRGIGYRFSPE